MPTVEKIRHVGATVILFFLIATLLIVFAVNLTLRRIELQLRQQTGEALQTVVATTGEGIDLWITTLKNPVSVLSHREEVVSAIQEQIAAPLRPETLLKTASFRELRRFLGPVLEIYHYDNFLVVDKNGIKIAAERPEGIGSRQDAHEEAIRAALSGDIAVRLSTTQGEDYQISLVLAAPVRGESGDIVAALAFVMNPTEDFDSMTYLGRIGRTGETYVFDQYGRILAGSSFTRADHGTYLYEGSGGLRDQGMPLTAMAKRAIEGTTGVDTDGYRDYRGNDVLGAWAWNDALRIGIATEIDQAEAMAPYRSIRALTLSMLSVIGIGLLALFAMLVHRGRILASNYAFRQAVKARQDTLAIVSHDLRAPLSNVLLCSGMIPQTSSDPAQMERLTGIIQRSARQMEKLVADLLDVSEIEMGRLKIEKARCEVPALFETVKETFAAAARSKDIQLTFSCPTDIPAIHADATRITQVLSNLVGNAIKFTPKNGSVAVTASRMARELRFEIRDTGPGVPEKDLSQVFDQFWKTKASNTTGKGLGLYIAKMIVGSHQGKIWAERIPSGGSAFIFTLPLR